MLLRFKAKQFSFPLMEIFSATVLGMLLVSLFEPKKKKKPHALLITFEQLFIDSVGLICKMLVMDFGVA
jgi:hypothetical protein